MASSQTTNYGLNQWAAEDTVLREAFNQDNAKIDMILRNIETAIPKIAFGQYTGTGVYGTDNPNVITFPFVPKLVLISNYQVIGSRKNVVGWFYGYTTGANDNDVNTNNVELTWNGTTLSWYSKDSAMYQLNQLNQTYHYCIIG